MAAGNTGETSNSVGNMRLRSRRRLPGEARSQRCMEMLPGGNPAVEEGRSSSLEDSPHRSEATNPIACLTYLSTRIPPVFDINLIRWKQMNRCLWNGEFKLHKLARALGGSIWVALLFCLPSVGCAPVRTQEAREPRSDVVLRYTESQIRSPDEAALRGSSYLATKKWVDSLPRDCESLGETLALHRPGE